MDPQILMPDFRGIHNSNLDKTVKRLVQTNAYKNQSTVIICPSRGKIAAKVIWSWNGLIRPMNQLVYGPIFALGIEVGEAYEKMIEGVLTNPVTKDFKYILTIEEDNCPPADGLLKLYEAIEGKVNGRKYDVVGGLYFTKGEGGQPMIYGHPMEVPKSFRPYPPQPGQIVEANGLGMGFNLFRASIFKDLPKPWFKSQLEEIPGKGMKCMGQDLYFYEKAAEKGLKFACDCRVLVGHYEFERDMMW